MDLSHYTKTPFWNDGLYLKLIQNSKLSESPHSHDFFKFIFVCNGSCTQVINQTTQSLHSGDICIIVPGDLYCCTEQSDDFRILSLSITREALGIFIAPYLPLNNFFDQTYTTHLNHFEASFLLHLINDFTSSNNIFLTYRKNLANLIISLVINHKISGNISENTPPYFNELLSQMHKPENIKEGIPALVRLSNFSHSHLCKLFDKYLDTTPSAYISELRMNYAYDLICNTSIPFEKISQSVGYSNYNHFYQKIKKTYKQSPSKLRRNTYANN
ncbi:MAG: AraC family transcriptional regulator [Acutalibacteraceae bacterium]|nr:AraC family transcriptional regulator [Acutalibacteraceae bacterium]